MPILLTSSTCLGFDTQTWIFAPRGSEESGRPSSSPLSAGVISDKVVRVTGGPKWVALIALKTNLLCNSHSDGGFVLIRTYRLSAHVLRKPQGSPSMLQCLSVWPFVQTNMNNLYSVEKRGDRCTLFRESKRNVCSSICKSNPRC